MAAIAATAWKRCYAKWTKTTLTKWMWVAAVAAFVAAAATPFMIFFWWVLYGH